MLKRTKFQNKWFFINTFYFNLILANKGYSGLVVGSKEERLEEVAGVEKAVTSNDIKEDVVMEKCEMLQWITI